MITAAALQATEDIWKKKKKADSLKFKPLPDKLPDGVTREEGQAALVKESGQRMKLRAQDDPTTSMGMYQKQAYRAGQNKARADGLNLGSMSTDDIIALGTNGGRERMEKGTMTMDDALALGLRNSKYGDFGSKTVTEGREPGYHHDRFGRRVAIDRGVSVGEVDLTADDWLAQQNKDRRALYETGQATQAKELELAGGREHDIALANIRAESEQSIAESGNASKERIAADKPSFSTVSTGGGAFSHNNDTGEYTPIGDGGGDPMKAADALNDTIYHYQEMINDPDITPEAKKGYIALRNKAISKRDAALGIGGEEKPEEGGGEGGGAMSADEFIADFTAETGQVPTAAQIEAAKGKYWK